MLWSHAYGHSMRYPCSLVLGLQDKVHMGTSVRSCAGLGIFASASTWRDIGVQWCRALRGPVRPASVGSGYIYQTRLCDIWPVMARKTTNWPSMGTKSLVAHFWTLYRFNLLPRDIWHNSKFFETSCRARILSASFMWHRHKISNA